MKKINTTLRRLVLIFIIYLLFSGCATRPNADSVFREDYQTPELDISHYKTPELRSSDQNNKVSVAVAISGGGHRAGNFGVGVLSALEELSCDKERYNILKEIDYLSTVSGGGFAAATYISTLYDHIEDHNNPSVYSLRGLIYDKTNVVRRNLERGYHNVLERAFISIKSLGNLDRGDFLEKALDKKILGAEKRGGKSLVLGDIFIRKHLINNPTLPMWVANATVYENGSIFPLYPQSFKEYKITEYTHNLKKEKIKEDDDIYSIPLSIGLIASASFPGAVPATTLTSSYDDQNPFLHLFDGGLADNLGVTTALKLLSKTGDNKKILIIIDAYKGQREPFSKQEGSPVLLQIYNRSTGISLDAWRIRHKLLIDQMASSNAFNGKPVEVIYLSFDDLSEATRIMARDITTDFNISEEEQETLLRAGEEIVELKKNELINAVYSVQCK